MDGIMADKAGDAFVLRPGVRMPDWSVVTCTIAREALAASMAAAARAEKWSGLEAAEDLVWQAVLLGFARSGAAPDAARLAVQAGLGETSIADILRKLRRRDLVVLDKFGAVTAAYPFSVRETGHRVRVSAGAVAVHALCAIDALGTGAMLGCHTEIESACRECGTSIRIATRDCGSAIRSTLPVGAVVWSGTRLC